MATYSHSKVSCFDNCPFQYKLQYIDKIKPDAPNTIEAFMGSMVHEALEMIYKNKIEKKETTLIQLKIFYKETWEKNYTKDILVVKYGMTAENYRVIGWKFLDNYYKRYYPFEELEIIGLETHDMMELPDGSQWHVRIDKLGKDKDGNYYVCDYKTSSRMKEQYEADEDRQLAMYSIWVKKKYKDAKSVKLLWHMLAFDENVISERDSKQEEKVQHEVLEKIKRIEKAEKEKDFPKKTSKLCDYCLFKSKCFN